MLAADARLTELLAGRTQAVRDLAFAAARCVRAAAPGVSELLYDTHAVSHGFTYSDRLKEAFIHIATYRGTVNLGFNRGASLPDPHGRLEGTGRSIRHVPLKTLDTLEDPAVIELIAEAVAEGRVRADEAGRSGEAQFIDRS